MICIESPEPVCCLNHRYESKKLPQSHFLNRALASPRPGLTFFLNSSWGSSFLPSWGRLWRLVSSAPRTVPLSTQGKGALRTFSWTHPISDVTQLSLSEVLKSLHSSHPSVLWLGSSPVRRVCWDPWRLLSVLLESPRLLSLFCPPSTPPYLTPPPSTPVLLCVYLIL